MDRTQGKEAVNEIRRWHPAIQFNVAGRLLYVRTPYGMDLDAQQELFVRMYREDIVCYLTTPPAVRGECWRGHEYKEFRHDIQWTCTLGGLWLCGCYYHPQDYEKKDKPAVSFGLRNYWEQQSQQMPVTASKIPWVIRRDRS